MALCHDRGFHVATELTDQAHNPAKASATVLHEVGTRARQRLLVPCRDGTFASRQGLGLGRDGLGRDRGFLCHDKVLLVMCRDRGRCCNRMWSRPRGLVSRHRNCVAIGLRDGRAPTSTTDEFCRDRESFVTIDFLKFSVGIENSLSRQRSFCLVSRRRFCVATGPGDGAAKALCDGAP